MNGGHAGYDGNLAALARYEAEVDRHFAAEEAAEAAAHHMLALADDPASHWHGGDAEEIALLRERAAEILARRDDPPEWALEAVAG